MMKTFTLKRLTMLVASLCMCIFAFAQEVMIDFNDNPMGWPTGKDKLTAETEFTYGDIVFVNHKALEGRANFIDDQGSFVTKSGQSFTLKAVEGKAIKSISFFLDPSRDFTLEASDKHIYSKEGNTQYNFVYDEPQSEITFNCVGKFGSKFNQILVVLTEAAEKEVEQTVIYDFNELNPAWSITDVESDVLDEQEGKIDDSYVLTQDGVALTVQNVRADQVVRVKDHKLVVPITNTITLTAPDGKKIKHVELAYSSTRSRIKVKDKTGELPLKNKVASYDPDSQSVVFEGVGGKSQIKKITLIVVNDKKKEETPTTSINKIEETTNIENNNNKVFNLNGVQVGTTETLSTLPKGIYIVKGLKVLVR